MAEAESDGWATGDDLGGSLNGDESWATSDSDASSPGDSRGVGPRGGLCGGSAFYSSDDVADDRGARGTVHACIARPMSVVARQKAGRARF